ncbi:MAG: aminotransferase class III-fold pyridoxal phosphate-dependent enzyme [Chlamydiota bacterium]
MEKKLDKSAPKQELIAQKLSNDPRVLQAKKLLEEAVREHQQHIKGVLPSDPEREVAYKQLLEEFGEKRGINLWYPYLGSGIGNGALVELTDGSVKYDFIGGIGVHYWGHSHLEIIDTCIDAAITDTTMQGNLQQNLESYSLTKLLTSVSGMDHCFLTSSGVMANENALKILFQYKHPADRILAFEHCFAGRTLAFASITDKPQYRAGLPPCLNVDYIPYYNPRAPKESTERALGVLKDHLKRYPNQHAAMIFELVQGEGGFYPGDTDFFVALMKELKKHDVKIFVDEVQTFGRLPKLFAFQYFQLEKYVDIVTIGKLSQVCATLYRKALKPKPGLLSQTFTGSSAQIQSGHLIIKNLIEENYFGPNGKIQKIHEYFVQGLENIEHKYPSLISGPWGLGAMIAFTPYDGDSKKVMNLSHRLFDAGVICFVTGSEPTRIRFLLPMGAITEQDIDNVLKIIEKTLVNQSE